MKVSHQHDFLADWLRGWDHRIGERLGWGAYGTVFQHKYRKDRVFKFLLGQNEARTTEWILQNMKGNKPPHRGLPAVYDIDTGDCPILDRGFHGTGFWLVEREALHNVTLRGLGFSATLDSHKAHGIWTAMESFLVWPYPWPGVLKDFYMETLRRAHEDFMARDTTGIMSRGLSLGHRKLTKQREGFFDFVQWVRQQGAALIDLHRVNMGMRDNGMLVLRDLGCLQLADAEEEEEECCSPSTELGW